MGVLWPSYCLLWVSYNEYFQIAWHELQINLFHLTFTTIAVTYKGKIAVAKNGVIVVLRKLNKFACCKEFSDQLCLHVLAARPEHVGKGELSAVSERTSRKRPPNPKSLLTQRFYCDQTCNVYEAGKRSFVEVADFVLY